MRHYLLRSMLAAMTLCVPITANAQQVCGPRRELIDGIKAKYGETESWYGRLSGANDAVALLLTSESGSWTLLEVRPDVACIAAAGTGSTPLFGDPA